MRSRLVTISALLLAVCGTAPAQATTDTVAIGRFSEGDLSGWEFRSFKGNTIYSLVTEPQTGSRVLRAASTASASGLFLKRKIDLRATPYLNWSWRVTNNFDGLDETTKGGDDFPARIYVVIERGVMGMSSLSLNYVWSSQHPRDARWPSPYTAQVQLLAVDSGARDVNVWVRHKRNVRADLQAAFGEDISMIDAVAVMTDTDNHGGSVESFYGDIWLSAE